jgi:hypothetical protein
VFGVKPAARPAPTPPAPDPNAPPPSKGHRSALPVLTAIGFIFVLLAIAWVWNSQLELSARVAGLPPPPPPGVEPARVTALEGRMNGFDQRLTELEHRPAAQVAVPDTGRVAALEDELKELRQQLTELANRPAAAPAPAQDADKAAALASQLTALEAQLKADEQREKTVAEQAAQALRTQQALAALDAGEPLGDLPGAPPALTRFAHAKPPTEASLRLSFPAAAAAAEQASRPSADGKSLGERILMHLSSLVTVKEGAKVLVGAPAATVLGEAQSRLEAGDIAGALTALDALDSSAAAAIAPWRANARALLDARAALAQMARG